MAPTRKPVRVSGGHCRRAASFRVTHRLWRCKAKNNPQPTAAEKQHIDQELVIQNNIHRALANATVRVAKAKAGSIVILDEAKSKEIKTGALAKQFGDMNIGRALVVDGEFDKNFQLSARNLADVALLPVSGINVYDIMKSGKLVLTTAAVKAIEARLGEGVKA